MANYSRMKVPQGYSVRDLPMGRYEVRRPNGSTLLKGGGINEEVVRRYIGNAIKRDQGRRGIGETHRGN